MPDTGGRSDIWKPPGAFLWVPTAVNVFVATEIVQLSWGLGGYNTGQGDFGILMHIAAASLPMAAILFLVSTILIVARLKAGPGARLAQSPGVYVLLTANIAAPFLLYFALKWLK